MSTTVSDPQHSGLTVEETNSSSATTSHGYVLPEGKIMPNTVFVGGIDIRMDEIEIREFFSRFGSVKEVKIITDRSGVSKGYGFVSYYDDVDVQKIVDSQINFHGKKLKLGPAIRKQQHLSNYAQPRPVVLSPPAPQFHNVWNNHNVDLYFQHPPISSVAQYVPACPYPNTSPMMIQHFPVGYQQPAYFQVSPQWPADQRSYIIPQAVTSYHFCDIEQAASDIIQTEYPVLDQITPPSPPKVSVDRSIQTVVSGFFHPENRLQTSFGPQEDYLKDRRVQQFRRSKAAFKTVQN